MNLSSGNNKLSNNELSTPKEVLLFLKKELIYAVIVPLILSIIIIICLWKTSKYDSLLKYIDENIIATIFQVFIIFMFVDLPGFLSKRSSIFQRNINERMDDLEKNVYEKAKELKDDVTGKMERWETVISQKIDNCPRMTSFHTEEQVMEKKIDAMKDMNKSSQRWMYSKFISKLLSKTFKNFSIDFDQTIQYSDFSSDIMKECTESVFLTSSMTPYNWLYSLAANESQKDDFFNNISNDIQLKSSNHSKTLKNIPLEKKKRVIYLSGIDYNHIFLFEKSLMTYLTENEGIETVFCQWDDDDIAKDIQPLEFEYALYDDSLLFKYEKKTNKLWVRKDGSEFNTVKSISGGNTSKCDSKDKLIKKVVMQKKELLTKIKNNNFKLPHKYSYLFHDKWTQFVELSPRFGEDARNAISDLILYFEKNLMEDETIDIVEIGAGNGDKIDLVCDRIGTENISSYCLVDISEPLCKKAKSLLDTRLKEKQNKLHREISTDEKVFDFCSDNISTADKKLFKDKTVFILNNSTIFPELDFNWQCLKSAKRIFITLDLFEDNNSKDLFEEYYAARGLFLSPLKIYGIPIVSELVYNDVFKPFFSDNSSDSLYTNDNPNYELYFNLKDYLEKIKKERNIVFSPTEVNSTGGDEEYGSILNDLANQNKIVVLSSLKFKVSENLNSKVKEYFNKVLGKEWTVISHTTSNNSYIGICIEKKGTNNRRVKKKHRREK